MAVADDGPASPDLESREPTLEDLRDLCRALNERGAQYVVVGGFAIRAAGYNRRTMGGRSRRPGRSRRGGGVARAGVLLVTLEGSHRLRAHCWDVVQR